MHRLPRSPVLSRAVRNANPRAATDLHLPSLLIRRGQYEVTIFSDVLEKCRDYLETGSNVVVTVEATMEADQLKLLARSISPIDNVVSDVGGMALKLYLENASALAQVASVLQDAAAKARNARPGEVSVCLMDPSLPGEVEMTLGQSFPLNPQVKGALKSLNDVIDVEEV